MKKWTKRLAIPVALILLGAFFAAPSLLDRWMNRALNAPPYHVSERARLLHEKLLIADLHADTLLWGRDPAVRATHGHVDIPRLIEGNVALQAFTVVTNTPFGLNIDSNTDRSDQICFLWLAQRRRPATWFSLAERVLDQAAHLERAAADSGGRFALIRSAADLSAYLERRKREPGITAGFLGVEGAHALEGDLENIEAFYNAGVRMMAPTHFFDTDVAGSAHGVARGGLTEKGREMIRRMEARKMILDLAHASPRTIADALAITTRPVVVSHTGVKGTCNNRRNLSDDELRGIARTGGVVGIGYWAAAVCGTDAAAIARAIRHAADVAGVDHVGLGSDFDGAIEAPFDTTGLSLVTEALLEQGFSDEEIAKIMGGNTIRVLLQSLP
jgi:microsomal dipeptidase-like Zn-dependent dipeptidase